MGRNYHSCYCQSTMVNAPRAKLAELALRRPAPSDGEEYAAVVRASRRLAHLDTQVVGLVPATRHIGVPLVAMRLAFGLSELGSSPVVVVDANSRLPAFADLVSRRIPHADDYTTLEIDPGIHLASLSARSRRAMEPTRLSALLLDYRKVYTRVLVDLTGFHEVGEHLDVYELLDGVIVIAHAGRTSERALEDRCRHIPERKNLGVLLVG